MAVDDHAAQQTGGIQVEHDVSGQWGLWLVVSVSGELDMATAPVLREVLAPDALPDGCRHLALDVSGLTFCDSSGLCVLVGLKKQMNAVNGRLALLHLPVFLARRLQQTGLVQVLPSYDSYESLDSA